MTIVTGLQRNGIKSALATWPKVIRSLSSNDASRVTLSKQHELQKLPVPKLQDTVSKWLTTTKPHLSSAEFEKTKELAAAFIIEAEPLQKYLENRAAITENWFSDHWLDMAYLGYRDPLTVWSNPGIVLPPQQFDNNDEKWLRHAAKIIDAALNYKSRLDNGTIPVEMSGKFPMDMNQYYKLFGATRIPGSPKDCQQFYPDSNYIVVVHRGNFFKLPFIDDNRNIISVAQIYSALKHILEESHRLQTKSKIGILTTDSRDDAYRTYELLKETGNSESVDTIDRGSFLLCLDDEIDSDQDPWSRSALNSLHGFGPSGNGFNRWFGKALQFIVAKSGEVGISNEHSFCEAVPVIAMADDILEKINGDHYDIKESSPMDQILHIPFKLDSRLENEIEQASLKLARLADDLEMKVLNFDNYGKEFIKSQKMSPDSFVQMAIQLSFYKMYKTPSATYESGGTRKYLHGRTEVIRSCSMEALEFSKNMIDLSTTITTKQKALKNAIASHNQYARDATNGYGVDRHLQGLKMAAAHLGKPIPELYNDPGYSRSSRMRLSTSQISSSHGGFACYGPLQLDGYGCCYSIGQNLLSFAVSSMKSNKDTDANKFSQTLSESLDELHDVCVTKAKL